MLLKCGAKVWIDSVYISNPYSGLIIGVPSAEMNEDILSGAMTKMSKMWGTRKTYLVPPKITEVDQGEGLKYPSLPRYMVHVWLQSMDSKIGGDGTDLILVFFTSDPIYEEQPLEPLVAGHLKDIDWHTVAGEFNW